jgi:hypothetical protein
VFQEPSERVACPHCTNKRLMEIPVPQGHKWLCERCGLDFCDSVYMEWRREHSAALHKLLDELPSLLTKADQ